MRAFLIPNCYVIAIVFISLTSGLKNVLPAGAEHSSLIL
jgi:hypothetical protein